MSRRTLLVLFLSILLGQACLGQIVVTNTQPGNVDGSLVRALFLATIGGPAVDDIFFDIPTSDPGYWTDGTNFYWSFAWPETVNLGSNVNIVGGSAGSSPAGNPTIVFDGSAGAESVVTLGSNVLLSDIAVINSTTNGIRVLGGAGPFRMTGSWVGISLPFGDSSASTSATGAALWIRDVSYYRVGTALSGNVLSGHFMGLLTEGSVGSLVSRVDGNMIGTDVTGTLAIPNEVGYWIRDTYELELGLQAPNVISGNRQYGLLLSAGMQEDGPKRWICDNLIGLAADGQTPLGNEIGIGISNNKINAIGCDEPGMENVVSGNEGHGLTYPSGNGTLRLQRSIVGLASDGITPVPNGESGVAVGRIPRAIIGPGNVISANGQSGVVLDRTADATIARNKIGTDSQGLINLGNGGDGVELVVQDVNFDNQIDASDLVDKVWVDDNVISGNGGSGISGVAETTWISDNVIGTNETGTGIIANAEYGIYAGAPENLAEEVLQLAEILIQPIGGLVQPLENRNLIAGNTKGGIYANASDYDQLNIRQNWIGVGPDRLGLPNLGAGISLVARDESRYGGTLIESNTIGFNTGSGIEVDLPAIPMSEIGLVIQFNQIGVEFLDFGNLASQPPVPKSFPNGGDGIRVHDAPDSFVSTNSIGDNGGNGVTMLPTAHNDFLMQRNAMSGNQGLGIDLPVTANDPGDGDEGPNRGQNSPEIIFVDRPDEDELTVTYRVDTNLANAEYPITVEFFLTDAEGEEGWIYLSKDDYATPGAVQTFSYPGTGLIAPFVPGARVVATATAGSNTSEFSASAEIPGWGAEVELVVNLAGPWSGGAMSTQLDVPTLQPYDQAPWFYRGLETRSPDQPAVDWVLLRLLSIDRPDDEFCYGAAPLRPDGSITTRLSCAPPGTYDIAVFHRNHLAVQANGIVLD